MRRLRRVWNETFPRSDGGGTKGVQTDHGRSCITKNEETSNLFPTGNRFSIDIRTKTWGQIQGSWHSSSTTDVDDSFCSLELQAVLPCDVFSEKQLLLWTTFRRCGSESVNPESSKRGSNLQRLNNKHCRILKASPTGRTAAWWTNPIDFCVQLIVASKNALVYETTEIVAWKVVYIFSLTFKRTKQKQKDDYIMTNCFQDTLLFVSCFGWMASNIFFLNGLADTWNAENQLLCFEEGGGIGGKIQGRPDGGYSGSSRRLESWNSDRVYPVEICWEWESTV